MTLRFPDHKNCPECEGKAEMNWKKVDPDTLEIYEVEYFCDCGESWREYT